MARSLLGELRTTSLSAGVGEAQPVDGRLRSPRPRLRLGDGLLGGQGRSFCPGRLGAHLARVELAEALTVLARRMPNLHRTGPAPWQPITEIAGPTTLPIAFVAGH